MTFGHALRAVRLEMVKTSTTKIGTGDFFNNKKHLAEVLFISQYLVGVI
jgi:hypothetical protein